MGRGVGRQVVGGKRSPLHVQYMSLRLTSTLETIIDWGAAVCCNVCVRVVLLVTAPESVHSSSKTTQDNAYMRSARKKWLQRTDMHKDG